MFISICYVVCAYRCSGYEGNGIRFQWGWLWTLPWTPRVEWALFNLLPSQVNCVRSFWGIKITVLHSATFRYSRIILTTTYKELTFVPGKNPSRTFKPLDDWPLAYWLLKEFQDTSGGQNFKVCQVLPLLTLLAIFSLPFYGTKAIFCIGNTFCSSGKEWRLKFFVFVTFECYHLICFCSLREKASESICGFDALSSCCQMKY